MEYHKQHHTDVTLPGLPHHKAVHDFLHFLDRPVDFSGTDTDPARVEDRITASVNDHSSPSSDFNEITMGPDSREAFEIGFLIFGVTRVVPEFDRHRGKRRTTDEFSFFLKNRIPLRIKSSGVHA